MLAVDCPHAAQRRYSLFMIFMLELFLLNIEDKSFTCILNYDMCFQ